ncbi:MAG: 3'-5' exonuclease [Weeksellaceae bacterium]|jgi:DNA polymerase-3 subunit epsilon|nr:3'-5' exonuclease [Weeksellaceae bacterium]
MKSFVAIDFETANQHRSSVCSVGVVIIENATITDSFYELIKPSPNFYCDWATDIHGINFWDTKNAKTFPEIWQQISNRIKGFPLVAHNSPFDESCLKAVHEFYEMDYQNYEFHCTCRTSRKLFPNLPNHQLHTVSEHLGFTLNNHHNALADAQACAHIAMKVF